MPEGRFPDRHSPAGRVLAHLVSLDVPGLTVGATAGDIAAATQLLEADVVPALDRLREDGFIAVEGQTAAGRASLQVTVLMAPPLDEYGVAAEWTGGTTTPAPGTVPPLDDFSTNERQDALRSIVHVETTPPPPDTAAPSQSSQPGADVGEPHVTAPARRQLGKSGPRRSAAAGEADEQRTVQVNAPLGARAAATDGQVTGGAAGAIGTARGRAGRSAGAPRAAVAGPAVDETAVLRGFVERFEQLLAETEEWKRRALAAEEHGATVERLLRSAERRAQTAEERLAAAQERVQSWTELTRRMQELARKADSTARPRGSAGRSRASAGSGTGDGTPPTPIASDGPGGTGA